ncbi:hypothetical protein [Legionella oakridgensis]|uniref:Uncharacterized protein n=2 Tax=Legionella oakridgensis TaxID=29423 RepID=W0BES0_9GAMM|nr:hypothetical protein [Legionella oakridgensis]AHE67127.1 hypothetical protein Loa_01579 [Legionella oakridgensis ATCC 33761 = DSM 21215]ETO93227.1 hypothetical protein LOR_18c01580 [Legionella oakridgensis RV-2-2007]KTD38063.1 hypothetical protein Loak_1739 [Legionella oakridgensis]STY20214.1 Uncharacterised protein [Legionella longbeachae]
MKHTDKSPNQFDDKKNQLKDRHFATRQQVREVTEKVLAKYKSAFDDLSKR